MTGDAVGGRRAHFSTDDRRPRRTTNNFLRIGFHLLLTRGPTFLITRRIHVLFIRIQALARSRVVSEWCEQGDVGDAKRDTKKLNTGCNK